MKVNCDIGERGIDNVTDIELMKYIDIANIACGGHAGNSQSVAFFSELAQQHKVTVSAHLSYPDKENFGRTSMNIGIHELEDALDHQYALLPDTPIVKLHGALYNDCWHNHLLSEKITDWFVNQKIHTVITPENSALAVSCKEAGIKVITEAFAERRYNLNIESNKMSLVSRKHAMASIVDLEEALAQSKSIKNGEVKVFINGTMETTSHSITAETICIHSDSAIALNLAKRLRDV